MAAAKEFSTTPQTVPPVATKYRRIASQIPHPGTLPTLELLRANESRSMRGQPPILWAKTHGFQIEDGCGNQWIDWSSGVLVGNAGHSHPRIVKALQAYLAAGSPIMTYLFPGDARAKLAAKLMEITPAEIDRVFLLTTGAEAVEVAIKLARTHGIRQNPKKRYIISYEFGFHGRTYGAQLAGGAMEWLDPNPYFVKVPFPSSIDAKDRSFATFEARLQELGVEPDLVAGVIAETFQGREAKLMPAEYAQALRGWCDRHGAALIFDEVQAAFGRTGKMFAFEHYGVVPDLFCCGKGITSSLPLSAVMGRAEYMDMFGPGEMTSTHTGSPLPAVAALASIEAIIEEDLVGNAARVGAYLQGELAKIAAPYQARVETGGTGLVNALLFFDNREKLTPDAESAFKFCEACMQSGNLFFSPVGKAYGAIKFCPPLCITQEAVEDGLYGPRGIKETLDRIMQAD